MEDWIIVFVQFYFLLNPERKKLNYFKKYVSI